MARSTSVKTQTALPEAEARALAEGRHGDPFGALGPHGGRVRAVVPQIAALWLVQGRAKPLKMTWRMSSTS